jgi:hypothetical protein
MEIKDAGIVAHFSNTGGFWNVVDALRIASFAISIVGYARILFDPVGWNLELPLPAGQIYVDFANLSEASEHYVLSCSIAIVLCLLSVMKYIRHSQAYGLLIITLTFAGPEIFRFMVRMFKIRMSKSHHLVPLSRLSGVIGSFCLARSLSESWLANHYVLEDLDSLEAIWVWLENVFVPCLFVDPEWYNGDSFTPQEEGFMMQYNKLVGGFQLLQKRVSENDEHCDPSPRFGDWAGNCYDEYYHDQRSQEPFGPTHDPEKYKYWAGNSREQAGFHVRFPLDREFAIRQLQELKTDKFLDKHTRDLQIDFTVYNENKHLFCVSLSAEHPSTCCA